MTTALAAAAFGAAPAGAQDSPEETGVYSLEEIVVTAQKRATNLQDTPIAISAFTGETMEDRGIDDISNLQSYVPNLHIGSEQDGFKISLRGIGLQGTTSINDSGVAFYIDNFYVSRPAGGAAVFYDIDRIEVLRGPQGTLYGRNATGGVVNVIPKTPQHNFEGQVGASYGSRNLWEVRGVLNVPVGDIAAARVSAVYTEEDGYVKNLSGAPGTQDFFGTNGDLTLRGQFLLGSPEDVEVLVSGSHMKLKGSGVAMQFLERNIGGPPPAQALLATVPAEDPDPLKTSNDAPSSNTTEMTMTSARITKDFGGAEAVVQLGGLWQNSDLRQDFDGSPVNVSRFRKTEETEAFSAEARLASTGSGPFSWIVGGYYYTEDTYIKRVVNLFGLGGGNVIQLPNFDLDEWGKSSTRAVFGSATYSLMPTFRVTAGGRYTKDKKSGTKRTNLNFGAPLPADTPQDAGFSKFTWKAGLEWDAARDVLVYASISSGYKAGGFNISSDGSLYDPEKIIAYEFGVKSDLFDRRVRLNLDSFYYDYTDMQLTTLGTYGPTNAPGQFTVNAGKSRIYGLELDGQFKVTSGLLLMASYAYTNAKFTELCNIDPRMPANLDPVCTTRGQPGALLDDNRVPYVARHTFNIGATYDVDLGSAGELTLAVNHNRHSKFFLREFNDPAVDIVGSNGKTDITVTYKVGETGLKVTGYVTNLEDDVEKTNIYISPGFVGVNATTAYTKPRTFGVRADYRF
ncbi:MAG: TonB-dependent receptor [Sphingobium sp.]|nr:TonB-dependent receptor [Sphingobium sp.]MCP5400120.1 TonB-dependent receptor [Sphingomonas sp.]